MIVAREGVIYDDGVELSAAGAVAILLTLRDRYRAAIGVYDVLTAAEAHAAIRQLAQAKTAAEAQKAAIAMQQKGLCP